MNDVNRRTFLAFPIGLACVTLPALSALACQPQTLTEEGLVDLLSGSGRSPWRSDNARLFAAQHHAWVEAQVTALPSTACTTLGLLRALGQDRDAQQLIGQHPGSAPFLARLSNPEAAAGQILNASGNDDTLQMLTLALVSRAENAAGAESLLAGIEAMGGDFRSLLRRGRLDAVDALLWCHQFLPKDGALWSWFANQVRSAVRTDDALDGLVWLIQFHGPAIRQLADRGHSVELIRLLNEIDPVDGAHVFSADNPAEAASQLPSIRYERIGALVNTNVWRLVERPDGFDLFLKWGAVVVEVFFGGPTGEGYSTIGADVKDRIAEIMRSQQGMGTALVLLRNSEDFKHILNERTDELTLNWVVTKVVAPDGSIDTVTLSDLARNATSLHAMRVREQSILGEIPIVATAYNAYLSINHGLPFGWGEVTQLFDDAWTAYLTVQTIGAYAGARIAAEGSRRAARAVVRSAASGNRQQIAKSVQTYWVQRRELELATRAFRGRVDKIAEKVGDTASSVIIRVRRSRAALVIVMTGPSSDLPLSSEFDPSHIPSGMRADMLGLHSISAVGVAESLSAVGADEDYSRIVNELLGRAHADLEEALERLGDEDGNRAQSQRDVASAFNRQLGIVWGLLRTT